MKKYKILYENGKEGFIDVCKEETMISVFEKLVEDKVKYIFVSGEKMKLGRNFRNKPIVLHSKTRDGKYNQKEAMASLNKVDEEQSLEELKKELSKDKGNIFI